MRLLLGLALASALAAGSAWGADYKTLRSLQAPPPITVPPLPTGAKPRAVEFVRAVFHPKDGEPWAIVYASTAMGLTDHSLETVTWNGGKVEAETSSFSRIFADELKDAGFAAIGEQSLFEDSAGGSADLKIGVRVDDIQGRYCIDCPSLLNPKGVPATVMMTARWEVFSSLERRVIARIDTTGGANSKTRLTDSVMPAVFDAFRENVRMLLASEEFRKVVLTPRGSLSPPTPPAATTITLRIAGASSNVPQASKSVAVVYADDGSGSGFLVSDDGYLLTNHHVVGGSKYVKLKWPDGRETLGEVIRSDPRRDVALIKTDAPGRAPLALRHSAVQQGETVLAIGTPLDDKLQNTMTKGIVSATREFEGQPYIQSDAAITHGNSGGPLIDERGAVVGLAVAGREINGAPVNLNFFIPIDDALRALALTPETPQVQKAATDGAARR
jgi:S1-C subfamily serine protease